VVSLVAFAVCSLATLAVAAPQGGNTNVVAGTVYEGEFGASQNTWNGLQVQFVVTPGGKVTDVAPAEAFCAPGNAMPLSSATIENDTFSVATPASLQGFHVTISGSFAPGGKAKGTGRLEAETIQSQPCNETGTWTATALPKGTQLCPDVDPGLLPRPTVLNMTCAKAALAFAAGVREGQKNPSSQAFDSPGYVCVRVVGGAPDVRETCSRGNEVLRLP
jgi:hypothetical protein